MLSVVLQDRCPIPGDVRNFAVPFKVMLKKQETWPMFMVGCRSEGPKIGIFPSKAGWVATQFHGNLSQFSTVTISAVGFCLTGPISALTTG